MPPPPLFRRGVAVPLSVALGATLAASQVASAAPTWLPAHALSASAQFSPTLGVALPSDGSAVALWTRGRFDPENDSTPTALESSVRVAATDPSASWPAASTAVPADVTGLGVVELDSGGVVGVVAQNGVVKLIRRAPGASAFEDLATMSDGGVGISPVPRIAANPSGDIVVSWHDATTQQIHARVRRSDGGLGRVQQVSDGHGASRTAAAIDDQGRATVVWSEVHGGRQRVRAARSGTTGAFASPVDVAGDYEGRQAAPSVGVAPDGAVTVTFAGRDAVVAARRAADAAAFEPHQVVSGGTSLNTYDSTAHRVLVDRRGTATVVWHGGTHAAPGGVYVARRSADAPAFARPLPVLPPEDHVVRSSTAAATPSGRVLVAWWQRTPGASNTAIAAAWVGEDGTVGTVQRVATVPDLAPCSSSSGCPALRSTAVAVDADGDAVVAWARNLETGAWVTEAAGYDAGGPLVDVAGGEDAVRVGEALTLTASARDRWSGVAGIDWDFGDGVTGEGPAVTRSYATPGTYRVRVRATDGSGNARAVERSIVVAPEPAPPPPPEPAPEPRPEPPRGRPEAPRSQRPTVTRPAGRVRIDARGRLRVATIACPPGPAGCKITAPRRVTVRVGATRRVVRVLAPRRVASGTSAVVRLRVPRAVARASRRGRLRAVVRLSVSRGDERVTRTVRIRLPRPAGRATSPAR